MWLIIIATILMIICLIFRKSINRWFDNQSEYYQLIILVFVIIFLVLYFVYSYDYSNWPSMFGLIKDVNSKDYIGYIVTLMSAGLSAIVLVVTTRLQIEESKREHQEKMSEDRRNSNMPLLIYEIDGDNISQSDIFVANKLINGSYKDAYYNFNYQYYNLYITNVGLNAAKNISVKFKHYIDGNYITKLSQRIIGKGLKEHSTMLFSYNNIPDDNIVIEIKYEDMFGNKYRQEIKLQLDIANHPSNNSNLIIMDYESCEPVFIKPTKKEKKLTK